MSEMRPEVGLCLELVHKNIARALPSQACGDVDIVVGVGDGSCLDLDHFGPESLQEVHLFGGLRGKRYSKFFIVWGYAGKFFVDIKQKKNSTCQSISQNVRSHASARVTHFRH